jgi:hypothetical protein
MLPLSYFLSYVIQITNINTMKVIQTCKQNMTSLQFFHNKYIHVVFVKISLIRTHCLGGYAPNNNGKGMTILTFEKQF